MTTIPYDCVRFYFEHDKILNWPKDLAESKIDENFYRHAFHGLDIVELFKNDDWALAQIVHPRQHMPVTGERLVDIIDQANKFFGSDDIDPNQFVVVYRPVYLYHHQIWQSYYVTVSSSNDPSEKEADATDSSRPR